MSKISKLKKAGLLGKPRLLNVVLNFVLKMAN
jgi:hypothetical protein